MKMLEIAFAVGFPRSFVGMLGWWLGIQFEFAGITVYRYRNYLRKISRPIRLSDFNLL
jgi:hypothetical protein